MAWQPIETAPKDQGIILTDGGGVVGLGAWFDGNWCFWEGGSGDVFWPEDGLRDLCTEMNYWIKPYGPAHWMPLPEPPK